MKKIKSGLVVLVAMMATASVPAGVVTFTGNFGVDNNFSTAGNWNTNPVTGDTIMIGVTNATSIKPAIVNSGFSTVVGAAKIYSQTGYGTGMSYVEVVSGGTLKASNLNVGNSGNAAFDGTLTLRKGGSIETSAANSGAFTIGGETTNSMIGNMFVEAGATLFKESCVQLYKYGTLQFIFGSNSVSTLDTVRTTSGTNNLLNGLLQVDLAALTTSGTYTLLNSSSTNLLIAGTMRTWLDGLGGSISGTGNYSSTNFAVLNGGVNEWTLSLADGNQDITLAVTYNASYTLTGSAVGNGTVSPASASVLAGDSTNFVITASNYYRIASLTTNGTAVAGMVFDNDSVVTNFIWSNVQEAGVLVATFTNRTSEVSVFTGNSGIDNNFSTAGNWNRKPLIGDTFVIGVTNATAIKPAIIDSGFSTVIANAKIYSTSNYGFGTAYAEVISNGLLKSSSLSVGNPDNANFDGTLTLRKGSSIVATFANSGQLSIGSETNGSVGNLFVEAGATLFSAARIGLFTYGTLTFISDTNSISTLQTTKTTSGTNNILNGLIRVDLAALATSCTNTLINSSSTNLLIDGAMRTWLDGLGGSISGAGNYSSANFAVLNGGFNEWTLALADGNQDLTLAVTYKDAPSQTTNGTPYSWLDQYGLTNYVADDVLDQDADGLKTWQEYIVDTDPTNKASCFKAAQATRNTVTWSPVSSGRVYSVYWSTNLMKGFTNLADNIAYPQSSYTNASPDPKVNHYQVKVRLQ